jgi:hypothetical protein
VQLRLRLLQQQIGELLCICAPLLLRLLHACDGAVQQQLLLLFRGAALLITGFANIALAVHVGLQLCVCPAATTRWGW